MRGSGAWARRAAAGLGVSLVAVMLFSPSAHAAPSLSQVRAEVQNLQSKAETANENFNQAQIQLSQLQAELATLNATGARQRRQVAKIMTGVDALARSAYASGGMPPSLQALLADNPQNFLSQAGTLQQLAQSQSAELRRVRTARIQLAQTEAAVAQKTAQARAVRNRMASYKQQADSALAQAQAVLNGLQAAARRQYEAQLAAARKRAQAEAVARRHQLAHIHIPLSAGGSARAIVAVRYALSRVGDRYIAAHAGPSSFDCSGLTMAAWRQAGVSLAHYSYSQFDQTRHISLSQAQPGDLLFYFGGGVHHVSMYIGGGRMVQAANPSSGVIITSVNDPWYRGHFSGVGRVLG